MKERIKQLMEDTSTITIDNMTQLEDYRIKYLGTKGILKDMFDSFKLVPNEEKKEFGQL